MWDCEQGQTYLCGGLFFLFSSLRYRCNGDQKRENIVFTAKGKKASNCQNKSTRLQKSSGRTNESSKEREERQTAYLLPSVRPCKKSKITLMRRYASERERERERERRRRKKQRSQQGILKNARKKIFQKRKTTQSISCIEFYSGLFFLRDQYPIVISINPRKANEISFARTISTS